MVRKDPGQPGGSVPVTFTLPLECGAEQVHVVGDFNDWREDATPLERTDHGFATTLTLDAGRTYRFRYLLDGERWENDWAADSYAPNDFGGDDSVLDLTQVRSTPDAGGAGQEQAPPPAAEDPPADGKATKPRRKRKAAASKGAEG